MITHHDDGVALFGPELAIQAPEWLGPVDERPSHVPKGMRWMPSVAFFQVLVDMKNSATVVPGQFAAKGHDYRADLLPFFHATLGFEATDEQLDRITGYLEFEELRRSRWIEAHGATGKSLAAAVLERLLEEQREQGVDPNARLVQIVRELAAESLGAGGGANVPPTRDVTAGLRRGARPSQRRRDPRCSPRRGSRSVRPRYATATAATRARHPRPRSR